MLFEQSIDHVSLNKHLTSML